MWRASAVLHACTRRAWRVCDRRGQERQRSGSTCYVIGETSFTPAFDALVGAPFLLQADMEFDLRAKHMKFFRPQNCSRDERSLTGRRSRLPSPSSTPAATSPNPHFTVLVNGKAVDAFIDTGASSSFLTLRGAKQARHRRQGADVTRLSDTRRHRLGPRRELGRAGEIGADRRRDHQGRQLGVVDVQGEIQGELLLGQDFLRAHRVLFRDEPAQGLHRLPRR
jgi:hypothetical protein